MSMSKRNGSRALIDFIKNFTDLQERNLSAVISTMQETVEGVMDGVQKISSATAENKRKANEVLVATYTSPDDAAKQAMDEVQDEVEKVFQSAQRQQIESQTAGDGAPAGDGGGELRDKLRRNAGIFSKHMEALETLDDKLQEMLLTIMGQLSRDDVLKQRIEHVMMALNALQASLNYILTDFDERCTEHDVSKAVNDLKSYAWRTYTMEEERKLFSATFGKLPATGRKAS